MKSAEKRFGVTEHNEPIVVIDEPGVSPSARVVVCPTYSATGSIDEMIKALREAANWLEWRRACEKREG